MTENPKRANAGDYRRAALLTMYRRQSNQTGQVAIVEEVNEANRSVQLLRALLVLHKTFITRFRTSDGISLLADYFHGIANLEPVDAHSTDMVRAAQIIDRYGHDDSEAIARAMNTAAAEGRATETILALLDHYEVALPELSGAAGIAFIEANAAAMREEEFRPDDDSADDGSGA
ncbi:hypothetical protein [Mycobacterium camsae]|uniref:hypothetical protein n=1 Tax=Mycobacterium gordonae TaxID=1778 RepID=UPI00197E0085|nr:hypothetical protein [Mycobacterium gordonae]